MYAKWLDKTLGFIEITNQSSIIVKNGRNTDEANHPGLVPRRVNTPNVWDVAKVVRSILYKPQARDGPIGRYHRGLHGFLSPPVYDGTESAHDRLRQDSISRVLQEAQQPNPAQASESKQYVVGLQKCNRQNNVDDEKKAHPLTIYELSLRMIGL